MATSPPEDHNELGNRDTAMLEREQMLSLAPYNVLQMKHGDTSVVSRDDPACIAPRTAGSDMIFSPHCQKRGREVGVETSGFLNVVVAYSRPRASLLQVLPSYRQVGMMQHPSECSIGDIDSRLNGATTEGPEDPQISPTTMRVLRNCMKSIHVAASGYWPQSTSLALVSRLVTCTASCGRPQRVPVPSISTRDNDCGDGVSSPLHFHPTRAKAITVEGYAVNRGMLVIAVDQFRGSEAKVFGVLSRSHVARVVQVAPHWWGRNYYVVVDEQAHVDPFVDIDLPLSRMQDFRAQLRVPRETVDVTQVSGSQPTPDEVVRATPASSDDVGPPSILEAGADWGAVAEEILCDVIHFLEAKLQQLMGARVDCGVIFTSSVAVVGVGATPHSAPRSAQEPTTEQQCVSCGQFEHPLHEGKISFHIHLRMADGWVFRNIRELHAFMMRVRHDLEVALSSEASSGPEPHLPGPAATGEGATVSRTLSDKQIAMLLRAIDFSVYTRWRAFRLPYNVKASAMHTVTPCHVTPFAATPREYSAPPPPVGSIAPAVVTAVPFCTERKHGWYETYRYLLPVIPDVTSISNPVLRGTLSRILPAAILENPCRAQSATDAAVRIDFKSPSTLGLAAVESLFELAFIQRDAREGSCTTVRILPPTRPGFKVVATDVRGAGVAIAPSGYPRPRPREGMRMSVQDPSLRLAVAEVFQCLSSQFAAITAERICVQYVDEVRGYYVQQRQSRYCLKQQRFHRGTFGQLYLTYRSIKFRCYSNDCFDSCHIISWCGPAEGSAGCNSADGGERRLGSPHYSRLKSLRAQLFPELQPEELLCRYGTAASLKDGTDALQSL